MHRVVLLRHGESDWNRENRFTGWVDVDLSDRGRQEAKAAAELLKTEGVTLAFAQDAVEEVAEIASTVNQRAENIGARRLYTVMEKLLEEVSFAAPEMRGQEVKIDAHYVRAHLPPVLKDEDLSRYIL